ncbi:MAG: hydroxyacylglutathione hydrolase [Alphaproteobacteria bacterium]|nr:hydroxyacylglutathione hydrolase [Alphaproteobacteria bacterium]
MISAQPVPVLSDNYAWLLRDSATGATAIVDPSEADPVVAAIAAAGGRLDAILLTHHHHDHIGGVEALRARFGARVVGAAADAHRLPRLDQAVAEGDTVTLGAASAQVMETPGHTRGHIAFFFPNGAALLCGDTLFSLGCGRLLEGTAAELFKSLEKFRALPPESLICCGHEYTEANARFALAADPGNAALQAYAEQVRAWRAANKPTVPSRLSDELAANPFLRTPDAAALADLRSRKDQFR